MKDFMQHMAENTEKARYIRTLFSPILERTVCTSTKYPDCLDCALGSSLGCVHYVQSRNYEITKQKISDE